MNKNRYINDEGKAEVQWVDPDTQFYIHEYDGSESIKIVGSNNNFLTP